MDQQSISLLIELISEGIGVVKELSDLAKRIRNGEVISRDEIQKQRASIRTAVDGWDAAGEGDKKENE